MGCFISTCTTTRSPSRTNPRRSPDLNVDLGLSLDLDPLSLLAACTAPFLHFDDFVIIHTGLAFTFVRTRVRKHQEFMLAFEEVEDLNTHAVIEVDAFFLWYVSLSCWLSRQEGKESLVLKDGEHRHAIWYVSGYGKCSRRIC